MSNPAGNGSRSEREAFAALESAVAHALERLGHMGRRVQAAEEKAAELEEVVHRFSGNDAEASLVFTQLRHLQEENEELRRKLAEGRAGVERLLAKVRFLENQQ